MNEPSGCDSSYVEAPRNVLAPKCTILAVAMYHLVVGSTKLVIYIFCGSVFGLALVWFKLEIKLNKKLFFFLPKGPQRCLRGLRKGPKEPPSA